MKKTTSDRHSLVNYKNLNENDLELKTTNNSKLHHKWRCVSNCGACCHLDPTERPDLENYLTPEELKLYLSMVGKDGWCVNFDRDTRKCSIYEERPRFCRVKPDIFEEMYEVTPEEFDEFAIACCHEQITGVYGENSPELKHYREEAF